MHYIKIDPQDFEATGGLRTILNQRTSNILSSLLRWTLGGMFLWAGAIKLANPKAFARSIDAFGMIPEDLLPPVAILLPIAEIFVGLAVLRRWRFGLPAMAALLVIFMAVLCFAISQNLDVDCGCFSVAEQREHTSVKAALVRDLLMLGGVVCLGMLTRCTRAVAPQGSTPISSRQGG